MRISKIKSIVILISILFFCLSSVVAPGLTSVQASDLWDMQEGQEEIPEAFGYATAGDPPDVREVAVRVVKIFLGFMALIFTIMIIFAGYRWMTAGGNLDKVAEAKKTIIAGIIGFLIVAGSYAITYFVVETMFKEVFGFL